MKSLARLLLAVALALTGCDLPAQKAQPASAPPRAESANAAAAGATAPVAALPDFTALMKQDGPAVVNIISTNKAAPQRRGQAPQDEDPMQEFFRRFMPDLPPGGPGGGPGQPRAGMGSGFIISADGYILTNAHMVADFDEVTVRLADVKREFKAKVVGLDKRTDVALIKVDAKDLPVVKLGDASKVEPGQWVAAIGSPFGFTNTITAGIVSATRRALPDESFVPFIQTDVAINPGNSGGPLLNLAGEVVGINSQIYSRTGGYMGVSFAIPIDVAMDVAKQLQASGKVTRGRLGVGVQPMTKELAKSFGLEGANGAVVVAVEGNSPAARAGIKQGDVILGFNGKPIEDPNELPRLVAGTKPGEKAQLELWRNGKREHVTATVGEFPPEPTASAKPSGSKATANSDLGLAVEELPLEGRKALGVDYGLVVAEVTGGPASRSPIQPGDVIVAVGQDRFRSFEEFRKLVETRKKSGSVALLVRRGDSAIYVPLEMGTG
jgi:serine protease Do